LSGHSALGRIGSAYVKLDNLAEAIKYFQKSLTEHRTPDVLAKLNEAEKEKKRRDREAYIDPAKAEEEREKGNTFFKAGDWPEAIKCYTEAIARLPADPRAYTNRAAAYIKLMAFPEADRDLEEAIKLDPNYGAPSAQMILFVHRLLLTWTLARGRVVRAAVKAHIRKATLQIAMKKYTEALSTLETATRLDTGTSAWPGGLRNALKRINTPGSSLSPRSHCPAPQTRKTRPRSRKRCKSATRRWRRSRACRTRTSPSGPRAIPK